MKMRPFLVASAVGAVVLILFSALANVVRYFSIPTDFNNPDTFVTGFTQITLLMSCVSFFVTFGVYAGMGWLYAFLHSRSSPIAADIGALGGAASAAVAMLASGMVNQVFSWLLSNQIAQRMGVVGPYTGPGYEGLMPLMMFSIGTQIIGLCVGVGIAAAVGAVAGAITGALISNRQAI